MYGRSRLSIIIPVLNSHEIVRRQLLHFRNMPLPEDVELIIVDDGSDPPLARTTDFYGARLVVTGDTRPWTQPRARNIGAGHAGGELLLFTDIDHIVPEESVRWCMECPHDFSKFRRYLAVLDEDGQITQDRDVMEEYGIPKNRGLRVSCHTLSMVIQREVFEDIGGYREKLGKHPTHDDGHMKRMLNRRIRAGTVTRCPDTDGVDDRPIIYVFPNGRFCGDKDYNPMGLFHSLAR
jgi:glycosyltransferase involved in cell wall biosynthesis